MKFKQAFGITCFNSFVGNTTNTSVIYQLPGKTSKIGDVNFVFGFRINRNMDLKKIKMNGIAS